MPDRRGQGAAGLVVAQAQGIVEADPDRGHQIGGEADEPGIGEVLAGAGLAGDGAVQALAGGVAGAALHHALHHRDHLEHAGRIGDRRAGILQARRCLRVGAIVAFAAAGAEHHMAVPVLHAVDQGGDHLMAARGQGAIGPGHAQHRGFHGAKRRGQHPRHGIDDMELDRGIRHRVHADRLGDADRDQVQ